MVTQLGVGGVLLLVLWVIVKGGDVRTKFEMQVREERTRRAEDQVDKLLPAIDALTDQTRALTDQTRDLARLMTELLVELRHSRAVQQADRGARGGQ